MLLQLTMYTTDAEIREPLQAALTKLGTDLLASPKTSVILASKVNDIAREEGRVRVLTSVRDVLAQGAGREDINRLLLSMAVAYPDDSWSGRGNDVRRAYNDGIRDTLRDLADYFRNEYWGS